MIRPYPWRRLPKLPRSDLRHVRPVRRFMARPEAAAGLARWASGCLGARTARVQLVGMVAADATNHWHGAASAVVLLAGPAGGRVALALDPALVAGIVGGLLDTSTAPPDGAPSAAECGVLTYGIAWLLAELPLAGWAVVESTSVARARALLGAAPRVFEALVGWDDRVASAWLVVEDVSCFEVGARRLVPPDPPGGCPPRLAPLRIELPVVLARFALATDELSCGLSVGDVVIAPTLQRERGWLEVGAGAFPVKLAALGPVVDGPYDPRGAVRMPGLDEVPTIAEQLPVELTVELGRVQLDGAEVVALGEGDVLTLDRAVGSAVDLRVAGRLLARGEIVDVEGEVGVRLIEVYG